jgi:DNA-binding response OmpR family regulator
MTKLRICLAGHAQPRLRALALASGGNDYLIKPFNLRELEMAINKCLGSDGEVRQVM